MWVVAGIDTDPFNASIYIEKGQYCIQPAAVVDSIEKPDITTWPKAVMNLFVAWRNIF